MENNGLGFCFMVNYGSCKIGNYKGVKVVYWLATEVANLEYWVTLAEENRHKIFNSWEGDDGALKHITDYLKSIGDYPRKVGPIAIVEVDAVDRSLNLPKPEPNYYSKKTAFAIGSKSNSNTAKQPAKKAAPKAKSTSKAKPVKAPSTNERLF